MINFLKNMNKVALKSALFGNLINKSNIKMFEYYNAVMPRIKIIARLKISFRTKTFTCSPSLEKSFTYCKITATIRD